MHIIPIRIITYLEASQPVEIISVTYFSIFPDEVFSVFFHQTVQLDPQYDTFQNNKIYIKMVTLHLSK
jgi:hypothetical protein